MPPTTPYSPPFGEVYCSQKHIDFPLACSILHKSPQNNSIAINTMKMDIYQYSHLTGELHAAQADGCRMPGGPAVDWEVSTDAIQRAE